MRSLIGPRGRVLALSGSWSLVAKICAAANLFVSLPFALHALGAVEFGLWATLVSFVTLTGFLDFGLGNGAMNLAASAHARQAHGEVATVLRAGSATLTLIAMLSAVVFTAIALIAPWRDWLGVDSVGIVDVGPAVFVVVASIVASVPLNLAARIRLGLGEGSVAFGWQAAGHLGALASVAIVASTVPSLATLTAAAVLPPVFAAAANTLHLWRSGDIRNATSPEPAALRSTSRRIREEGFAFFLLQLAMALAFMSDLPLITAILGAERAGEYAIVQRVFSVVPLALTLLWAPLWPVYRQSLAKRDLAWTSRTFRWTTLAAVGFAFAGAGIIAIAFRPIGTLWLSIMPVASTLLLGGFVVWCVLEAAGNSVAALLNAASVLRYQVVTSVAFAIACFVAKIWAVSNLGTDWIPWVTTATYLLATGLPLVLFWRTLKTAIRNGRY